MFLGFAALFWSSWRDLGVFFSIDLHTAFLAIFYTLPLLLLNGVLYFFTIKGDSDSQYARFFKGVIIPLCQQQTIVSAICIGIVSGFGEELLFRGAITRELLTVIPLPITLILVNALFAYVHFWGAAKNFFRVVFFYFLFGMYFSFLAEFKIGIAGAVVCHGLYNTVVILTIRSLFSKNNPTLTSADC